jgi:hypothetical protein
MGWSILFVVGVMTIGYFICEWAYDQRKYPYRWTCPYCKSVGTKFAFKGNQYADVRYVQLNHLDNLHDGAL